MKALRLAYLLLISVLATTCILSGTFAKYVSVGNITESARVAKWGVNFEISGSLFGDAYGGPTNTIVYNKDGSVTVKSLNSATLSELIAPGTRNDDGLYFSLTGNPETAVMLDWKVINKNVALRPNIFGIMQKIGTMTPDKYASLLKQGKKLYVKASNLKTGSEPDKQDVLKDGYTKATDTDVTSGQVIYELYNIVEVKHTSSKYHFPYCPVVFELRPSNTTSISGYKNSRVSLIGNYWVFRNEKSLDLLSAAIDRALNGSSVKWPVADKNALFIRSGSRVLNPNTDLSSLQLVDEKLVWYWDYQQAEDRNNVYARLYEDNTIVSDQVRSYNAADTILSTLAGKKIDSSKDAENKKFSDIEVVIHNRSLTYESGHVIFGAYKNKSGNYDISYKGLENWNNLADEWIPAVEGEDYNTDIEFDLEVTISQVD